MSNTKSGGLPRCSPESRAIPIRSHTPRSLRQGLQGAGGGCADSIGPTAIDRPALDAAFWVLLTFAEDPRLALELSRFVYLTIQSVHCVRRAAGCQAARGRGVDGRGTWGISPGRVSAKGKGATRGACAPLAGLPFTSSLERHRPALDIHSRASVKASVQS